MTNLFAAGVVFLGTHLGISSSPLRGMLVRGIGERVYLVLYVLVSFVTLGWLILAYNQAPHTAFLWSPSMLLREVAVVVMAFASIFLIGAFTTKNPTVVGQEGLLRGIGEGRGLVRITRHPFQWAVILWAAVHILANGDSASLIFFGSLGLVSLVGTFLLDRKKAVRLGEDWRHFAEVTSNVPFAAILRGKNRLALGELWLPALLGLGLYALLLWQHAWVSGVSLLVR